MTTAPHTKIVDFIRTIRKICIDQHRNVNFSDKENQDYFIRIITYLSSEYLTDAKWEIFFL